MKITSQRLSLRNLRDGVKNSRPSPLVPFTTDRHHLNIPSKSMKGDNASYYGSQDTQSFRLSLSGWKWEIAGVILSLSSFAASIILLAIFNGQRVDSWAAPFSLNTFISILAQTSRTSLAFGVGSALAQLKWNVFTTRSGNLALFEAFDEASKGPWGSLNLLYRLRSWSPSVLGAIVITTLLSYEPFAQACITQYGELDQEPSRPDLVTSISRSQRLDFGSISFTSIVGEPLLRKINIEDDDQGFLTAAYMAGSASDLTTNGPYMKCPTGNCTFGNYASLSICSSCADVSYQLKKSSYVAGGTPYTDYTLWEDQLGLSNTDGLRNPLDRNHDQWRMASTSDIDKTQAFKSKVSNTTLVVTGIILSQPDFLNNMSAWNTTFPKAMECALYYCTNVYSSSVLDGTLNEAFVGSVSHRVAGSYYAPPYNGNLSSSHYGWAWRPHALSQSLDYDYPRSDLQLSITEKEAESLGLAESRELRFNVSQAAMYSIKKAIMTALGGEDRSVSDGVGRAKPLILGRPRDPIDAFRALAESITLYIRDQGYKSSAHDGISYKWVLHYRIRWEFLTLPLLLTVAGCFFILYTIWETQSLGLMVWKESTLATLAHGLDALTRAKMREAYLDHTEENSAREIFVKVERFWGGIELCEVHSDDLTGTSAQRDSRLV